MAKEWWGKVVKQSDKHEGKALFEIMVFALSFVFVNVSNSFQCGIFLSVML